MQFRDIKEDLGRRRGNLYTGAALLTFGAALLLVVLHFDKVLAVFRLILSALTPVFCGMVVAFVINVFVKLYEDHAFHPLDRALGKRWQRVRYPLAVVLGYLTVALLLGLILGLIIPGVAQSLSLLTDTLQRTLPGTVNAAVGWVERFARENGLEVVLEFTRSFNWSEILKRVTELTSGVFGAVVSVTANVASGVVTGVMGFFFSVYMLFGKNRLLGGVRDSVRAFLPKKGAEKLQRVGSLSYRVFYSFVRGQLLESAILGTLCYVGMCLLRLDYALLISSIVGVTALIPILGAYIGCGAGVLVLLLVHPIDALVFLIFLVILQQVEGNFIYPRVVGSSMGLPAVWTLFAVLFWGGVLGVPGILIGTPATAVCYKLFRDAVQERLERKRQEAQKGEAPLEHSETE